jgi:hypothetical protein
LAPLKLFNMIVVVSCSQIGVYGAKTAKLALLFHRDGEVRDSTNTPHRARCLLQERAALEDLAAVTTALHTLARQSLTRMEEKFLPRYSW